MGRAAAVRAATKSKTDAAKAKNNNRFAKKIIMVVKAAGPDPEQNRALAATIKEAKASDVPMDVIKRNIVKAADKTQADYSESLFEFVGAAGINFLVNVVTDNGNRAANDINLVGKKTEFKAGSKGSVAFNFDRKSRIDVNAVLEEDAVLELCLEAGVDDFDLRTRVTGNPTDPSEEGKSVVFCNTDDMVKLRDALSEVGFECSTRLTYVPKAGYRGVQNEEDFQRNLDAIAKFEECDDCDCVDHDMDLSVDE
jgi:YebC/PmpR family DNA-binding regulatory protein